MVWSLVAAITTPQIMPPSTQSAPVLKNAKDSRDISGFPPEVMNRPDREQGLRNTATLGVPARDA